MKTSERDCNLIDSSERIQVGRFEVIQAKKLGKPQLQGPFLSLVVDMVYDLQQVSKHSSLGQDLGTSLIHQHTETSQAVSNKGHRTLQRLWLLLLDTS